MSSLDGQDVKRWAVMMDAKMDAKTGSTHSPGQPLETGELLNVRGHVYRVVGRNAYGQPMLEEIRWPTDAERMRAITTVDLLRVLEANDGRD